MAIIEERIFSELMQRMPTRLLAEGDAAQELAQPYLSANPDCTLLVVASPADAALVYVGENSSPAMGFALIGRTKQMASVVLVAHTSSLMQFSDFLALGLQRLIEQDAHGQALYLFDLHTYKTTPDWLNAKYWANPELWKP